MFDSNKTLEELRELNSGANPERIDKEDIVEITGGFLKDIEGHIYEQTACKTEVEYILKFQGIYGVVHKDIFYCLL